jgi:hypothetical protein
MKNASARVLSAVFLLMTAAVSLHAEDYMCRNGAGCTASIVEDGSLQQVVFRRGDIVSTEAGWIVSPEDGWVKVRAKDHLGYVAPSLTESH